MIQIIHFLILFFLLCTTVSPILLNASYKKYNVIDTNIMYTNPIVSLVDLVSKGDIQSTSTLYADSVTYNFSNGNTFNGTNKEWIQYLSLWRMSLDTLIPCMYKSITLKDSIGNMQIEVHHSWFQVEKEYKNMIYRTSIFSLNKDHKIRAVSQFDRIAAYTQCKSTAIINAVQTQSTSSDSSNITIIKALLNCEEKGKWYSNKRLFHADSLTIVHSNGIIDIGNTDSILHLMDKRNAKYLEVRSNYYKYYSYSSDNTTQNHSFISLYGKRITEDNSHKKQSILFHRVITLDSNQKIRSIDAKAQQIQ